MDLVPGIERPCYVLPDLFPVHPMDGNSGSADREHTRSKVGRLIADHGLQGVGAELESRWIGNGYERESLRSLADLFNRRLLATKLRSAGEQPVQGEVKNLYRLLTDDDVGAGARVDAETKLEDLGLDPNTVRREFVSHQAIHTYLTEFRDVSKPDSGETDRVESTRETIQRLRNRLVAVTENSLESLIAADHLYLGDYEILVDVQVFCEDCGTSRPLTDVMDRGGCDCSSEA